MTNAPPDPRKDERYFPNQEELSILATDIKRYFKYPKRSNERKQINEETLRKLNEINAGRWSLTTVRVWFTNNQKQFLDPPNQINPSINQSYPYPDNATGFVNPPPPQPQPLPNMQQQNIQGQQPADDWLAGTNIFSLSGLPSAGISGMASRTTSLSGWLPSRTISEDMQAFQPIPAAPSNPVNDAVIPSLNNYTVPATNGNSQPQSNFQQPNPLPSLNKGLPPLSIQSQTPMHPIPNVNAPSNPPPLGQFLNPTKITIVEPGNEQTVALNPTPGSFDESSDTTSLNDRDKLPPFPVVSDDDSQNDRLKCELYAYLAKLYVFLGKVVKQLDPCERLEVQMQIEDKFKQAIDTFHDKLNIIDIYTKDKTGYIIEQIFSSKMKRQFSTTTKIYNNEEVDISDEQSKFIETCPGMFVPQGFKVPAVYDQKLKLLAHGIYKGDAPEDQIIENVQCASFLKNGQPIYVTFSDNSRTFQIHRNDIVKDTGFFHKCWTMCIDEPDSIVWVAGDCRLRGFDIETLELKHCLQAKGRSLLVKPSIAIWNGHIVLANDAHIYLWKKGDFKPSKTDLKKDYLDLARGDGLNLESIDWKGGSIGVILPNEDDLELQEFTSICAVGDKLVIASDEYFAIRVIDTDMKLCARLVGHTAGITCLLARNETEFFSGSKDKTIRIWDLVTSTPTTQLFRHGNDVTSMTYDFYESADFAFTGGKDFKIRAWNLNMKKPMFEASLPDQHIPVAINFNPQDVTLSVFLTPDEKGDIVKSIYRVYHFETEQSSQTYSFLN